MNNNLSEKQEEQLYNFIEERLQRMSYQDLLEFVREQLIDFYFDWGKAELIESNFIQEDK